MLKTTDLDFYQLDLCIVYFIEDTNWFTTRYESTFFFYLTKDTYSHALVKQKTHILCKWHPS